MSLVDSFFCALPRIQRFGRGLFSDGDGFFAAKREEPMAFNHFKKIERWPGSAPEANAPS